MPAKLALLRAFFAWAAEFSHDLGKVPHFQKVNALSSRLIGGADKANAAYVLSLSFARVL